VSHTLVPFFHSELTHSKDSNLPFPVQNTLGLVSPAVKPTSKAYPNSLLAPLITSLSTSVPIAGEIVGRHKRRTNRRKPFCFLHHSTLCHQCHHNKLKFNSSPYSNPSISKPTPKCPSCHQCACDQTPAPKPVPFAPIPSIFDLKIEPSTLKHNFIAKHIPSLLNLSVQSSTCTLLSTQ
jgi:hypothetical protein